MNRASVGCSKPYSFYFQSNTRKKSNKIVVLLDMNQVESKQNILDKKTF